MKRVAAWGVLAVFATAVFSWFVFGVWFVWPLMLLFIVGASLLAGIIRAVVWAVDTLFAKQ